MQQEFEYVDLQKIISGQFVPHSQFIKVRSSSLSENGLLGYVFSRSNLKFSDLDPKSQTSLVGCIGNTDRLIVLAKELDFIFTKHGISHARIKGACLVEEIFKSSVERSFTDVDYLIEPSHFSKAKALLEEKGFVAKNQILWTGNRHRVNFEGEPSPDWQASVDVHTHLFWERMGRQGFFKSPLNSTEASLFANSELSIQEHFLYLIYNYSYQDNFVGLYKLLDIYLFWQKHGENMDFCEIEKRAVKLGMKRCLHIVWTLISDIGALPIPYKPEVDPISKFILHRLQNSNFLSNPQKNKKDYLIIKMILKDHWTDNLIYNWEWLKAYGWLGVRERVFGA